jgi:hypothetical protein
MIHLRVGCCEQDRKCSCSIPSGKFLDIRVMSDCRLLRDSMSLLYLVWLFKCIVSINI